MILKLIYFKFTIQLRNFGHTLLFILRVYTFPADLISLNVRHTSANFNVFLHFMAWLFSAATYVLIELAKLFTNILKAGFQVLGQIPPIDIPVKKFKLTIRCM